MKTGDVYYWDTDKAKGHASRWKYHIFICEMNWEFDTTFLFICSDNYPGAFRIWKSDCVFLPKEESFISCSGPVQYTDTELASYSIEFRGKIPDTILVDRI